jgi:hypothetical protein
MSWTEHFILNLRIYHHVLLPVDLHEFETSSLTCEENKLSENKVLRRISGPEKQEMTGEWMKKKVQNKELQNLYSSPNIYEVSSSSNAEESGIRISFAGDLVVGAVTSVGYQRTINCMDIHEFCNEWKLRINAEKMKRVVFKMGGKLSKNLKWRSETEEIELQITLNK